MNIIANNKKTKEKITKTGLKKATEIGVKTALSTIPGANAVYDLGKLAIEQVKEYQRQKQERRIEQFHQMLLSPGTQWNQALADVYIEIADYHLLLSACIQDLEDEKTSLYSALTKHVATKKIETIDIRFFTLSLKEFSYSDVEEMRIAYVAAKYPLINPTGGGGNFKKDLSITTAVGRSAHGRRIMELRGFTDEGMLNSYGEKFIESCYLEEQLTPSAINMRKWENDGSPLAIICYEIGSNKELTNFCVQLSELLHLAGYKCNILAVIDDRFFPPPYLSLLIIGPDRNVIIQHEKHLQKLFSRNCLAVIFQNEFPVELLKIKPQFKEIIQVKENIPFDAAREVAILLIPNTK